MAIKPGDRHRLAKSPGIAARRLFVLLVANSGLAFQSVNAQGWEFEPYVEVVATYTDNLYLLPEGLETPDYVGQVNPGFTATKTDGRFTTDAVYRLQGVFFSENSDLNTTFHQLAASAALEVATDRFFIDLDANIDQSVVEPTEAIPTSNVVATENLGDVTFVNVNPYLVQRLGGSNAFVRADYVYGIGRYDNFGFDTFSRVDDFDQDIIGLYIGTSEQDAGFDWSLTYDNQTVDYEVIEDYNFERAGASIGVPLSRNFRLVAMGGLETDILQGRNIGGLDSDYWEVGFRIVSGQRNSFEFRTGERFFGTSYFGSFEHDGRVFNASVTYTQNPTTSALDGPGSAVATFSVTEVEPIFEDSIDVGDIVVVPIRAEVYVSKMLRGRVELRGGRSLLYVSFYDEERDFIDSVDELGGASDGQSGLTAGYEYELGPRTDVVFTAALARYDYAETDVHTDIEQFILGINRQIGRETDVRLSLRRADQETNSVEQFGNYVENAVDLRLVRQF